MIVAALCSCPQTRGNVIKVDRHKYVKVAYHGFRSLSSEERNAVYNHSAVRGLHGCAKALDHPSVLGLTDLMQAYGLMCVVARTAACKQLILLVWHLAVAVSQLECNAVCNHSAVRACRKGCRQSCKTCVAVHAAVCKQLSSLFLKPAFGNSLVALPL